MPVSEPSFYNTGGTLRLDAPSYVERRADKELVSSLRRGEFCYLLTARQMGKSSMMVRTVKRLRDEGTNVAALDLTMIGQNLNAEQWYDGLLVNLGRQLRLEDPLEEFWLKNQRFSPIHRWFAALREIVLPQRPGPLVIFIDEIDAVRSLPFAVDEFFAAMRGCYNQRVDDVEFNRLSFCLLGVATPAELSRDPHATPFGLGRRIELTDFTPEEAEPLAAGLPEQRDGQSARGLLERILYWTHGHPYLTQRLCLALVEPKPEGFDAGPSTAAAVQNPTNVDHQCETLFLSPRARERDDNLLFVRERILRSDTDLSNLLDLYDRVRSGHAIRDEEGNELINYLRLAGIVRTESGQLAVRNRIYHEVFDNEWIKANMPEAELEKPDGARLRLRANCSIGRSNANDVALPDERVSRRHAVIQRQKQDEFWLMDLNSSNGTFLNGRRITSSALLHHHDQIRIAQFLLIFHQPRGGLGSAAGESTLAERTLVEYKRPTKAE